MTGKRFKSLTTLEQKELLHENKTQYQTIQQLNEDLTKLREVMRREERGYINRLTNLEDLNSYLIDDKERLQIVIETLGKSIRNLQSRLRQPRFLNQFAASEIQTTN